MIKKLLKGAIVQRQTERRAELYRNLIRHEAQIGGKLFGAVKPGGRREFFCLDETTWVWHEEWVDAHGQPQSRTTRYDVRPSGVLKSQDGQYHSLSAEEAKRFHQAVKQYTRRVTAELYSAVA